MKRKIILLCMLLALFAQVRYSQKAITNRLLHKDLMGLSFAPKANEPFLSLGSVRAAIIKKKVSDLLDIQSPADEQATIFITNHISEK